MNFEILPQKTSDNYRCVVMDIENKSFETVFEKRFQPPLQEIGHIMICPTDKNKVFFCHEGNTFYVSNRLWLWEKDKGMHCMAKQCLTDEGDLGDCFGHECWAPDGKGIYFIKYPVSPTPPTGICYVDTEFNQTDVLYGKYRYWHVCAAAGGRYLAADTFAVNVPEAPTTEVCVIDMETGKEQCVAIAGTIWNHPAHPHPSFSPDDKNLIFHDLYDGKVTVSIIALSDINWD